MRGGAEKNVLCSDWEQEYVQGQSWTMVVVFGHSQISTIAVAGSMVVVAANTNRGNPVRFPEGAKYLLCCCREISV